MINNCRIGNVRLYSKNSLTRRCIQKMTGHFHNQVSFQHVQTTAPTIFEGILPHSTQLNLYRNASSSFQQWMKKKYIHFFDILKMTYLFVILIITWQTKNMALKDKEGWRILGKKQSASLQRAIKPKGRTCSPYWRWPRWRLMCALRSGIQVTFREELSNRKGCELNEFNELNDHLTLVPAV